MELTPLTSEECEDILASGRVKGLYKEYVEAFISSDLTGTVASLETGPFKGKTAVNVAQSFRNHLNGNSTIRVVARTDKVALIKMAV